MRLSDMTNIDLVADTPASRVSSVVRDWWPVPAVIGAAVIAQRLLLSSHHDVGGHAAEHLASASAPFMASGLLCLMFWATPPARCQPDLLAAAAVWFTTTLIIMIGNLRVVDDLVAAGYSHTPTGSVPDVADHSLANSSVWYAQAAALLLIGAWRRRSHIGNRAAIGAVIATIVIPPWLIPGAGMIVVTAVCLVRRARLPRTHRRGLLRWLRHSALGSLRA
jgi:hypothetical protein